ncbi:MAG TPA: hypothetical protein DEB24_01715 [Coriobacteriia bacterium]|nr:hypothetical protein [Coriobacteriia bacterium]
MVKELVIAHGGRVEVYSVYKQGSIFTVHIPIENRHNDLVDGELI